MFQRRAVLGLSLLCATSAGAQQQPAASPPSSTPPFATIVGAVIDSLDGGPLQGASVMVAGTDRLATVDSTGRFRIDSVPPGDHALGVFHPLLDSLNLSVASKAVTFSAGMVTTVILATPSAASTIGLYCSTTDRQRGPGAVLGRVLAAEGNDPITNAVVRYTSVWTPPANLVPRGANPIRETFIQDAKVTSTGTFVLCGLPIRRGGTVHASRGQIVTGEVIADISKRGLAIADVRLDTLKSGSAIVIGRIVDDKGVPISRVDVTILGSHSKASTSDSGTFALRDLPGGSQTIEIRKVGFTAIDTGLVLSGKSPTQFSMTLHPAPPTLSTVNVAAAREAALKRVGFDQRRRSGLGHYLTADDIQNRGAVVFSDIARTIPGLVVRTNRSGQPVITQGRGAGSRGCVAYSLDGAPYQDIPRGSIDSFIHPSDIIGVEVYDSLERPAEIMTNGANTCAVIVIWTRASSGGD
jgi:Carboxypeptidase regulatory-like domain/TonB-dependent Receptor Plug Domain